MLNSGVANLVVADRHGTNGVAAMDDLILPDSLREALTVDTGGATGVTRLVIAGLLEIANDRSRLEETAALMAARLPGYASLWHIVQASRSDHPELALRRIRQELDEGVSKSVAAAREWVIGRGGNVAVAPSSSLVEQVLRELGDRSGMGEPTAALAGADAVGPTAILNIKGTLELAKRLPTLVVTTSLKLVPETVFADLETSEFERIPLELFTGVVIDGEIISPAAAGERARHVRSVTIE